MAESDVSDEGSVEENVIPPQSLSLDPEKQKEFENKVKDLSNKDDDLMKPGVIYLGHLPHGFYEEEIKGFFSQFGVVNRVKVSRSRKTAHSKGYAFVEFACSEVAEIAAETMDNYLMFERLLKCEFLPEDRVHPRLWKGTNRKIRMISYKKNEQSKQNKVKGQENKKKLIKKLISKEKKKKKFLLNAGVQYDFPGYSADKRRPSSKKGRTAK